MEEEKKIVLGLLESGVITKDEAYKLLDAIDRGEAKKSGFLEEEFTKLGVSIDKLTKKAKRTYKKHEPSLNASAEQIKKTAFAIFDDFKDFVNLDNRKDDLEEEDIFEHDDFVKEETSETKEEKEDVQEEVVEEVKEKDASNDDDDVKCK